MAPVPPNNVQAEQDVLSAMMLDRAFTGQGVELLTPADFYRVPHQTIFEAMRDLYLAGKPTDLHILCEELVQRGQIEHVGGADYLMATIQSLPTAHHLADYAAIAIAKLQQRDLMAFAAEVTEAAADCENVQDVFSLATDKLMRISDRVGDNGFMSVQQATLDVLAEIEARNKGHAPIPWFKTGLHGIDRLTEGVENDVVVITGGGTSQGKTAFAMQSVEHNDGAKLYYSMEMSAKALIKRWLASLSEVTTRTMNTGKLEDGDIEKLMDAQSSIMQHNVWIYDRPVDVGRLTAQVHRAKLQHKASSVYVDYVGLLRSIPGKRQDRREREVAENIQALQGLARTLGVRVVIVSQISRKNQDRSNKRASLTDLKESGEIENAADLVLAIYNPPAEDNAESITPREAEIDILKQRNGPTGRAKVMWHPTRMRFYPRSEDTADDHWWDS